MKFQKFNFYFCFNVFVFFLILTFNSNVSNSYRNFAQSPINKDEERMIKLSAGIDITSPESGDIWEIGTTYLIE